MLLCLWHCWAESAKEGSVTMGSMCFLLEVLLSFTARNIFRRRNYVIASHWCHTGTIFLLTENRSCQKREPFIYFQILCQNWPIRRLGKRSELTNPSGVLRHIWMLWTFLLMTYKLRTWNFYLDSNFCERGNNWMHDWDIWSRDKQ